MNGGFAPNPTAKGRPTRSGGPRVPLPVTQHGFAPLLGQSHEWAGLTIADDDGRRLFEFMDGCRAHSERSAAQGLAVRPLPLTHRDM